MTAIRRVPILPLGMLNAHLIACGEGCILVDAGLPGSEAKIATALRELGLAFKDIRLIVLTHAHVDHAGNAAALRELSGAPIVAHDGDAQHYRRKTPMTFRPTGRFGRMFLMTRLIAAPYRGFTPDILLKDDEALDLGAFGVPGTVQSTPGHTAGSISVKLARDALVGDLISSGVLLGGLVRMERAKRPPFEDDPRRVAASLQRLIDSGVETFHMGHGGPLPAAEVQRHARALQAA